MFLSVDDFVTAGIHGIPWAVFLFILVVSVVRLALSIPHYIKTGTLGNVEDSFAFMLFGAGFSDVEEFGDAVPYLFTESDPAGIFTDACFMAIILFIALMFSLFLISVYHISFPIIIVLVAVVAFARKARERFLAKEEFNNRLRGIEQ